MTRDYPETCREYLKVGTQSLSSNQSPDFADLQREVALLQRCSHAHLLPLLGCCLERTARAPERTRAHPSAPERTREVPERYPRVAREVPERCPRGARELRPAPLCAAMRRRPAAQPQAPCLIFPLCVGGSLQAPQTRTSFGQGTRRCARGVQGSP